MISVEMIKSSFEPISLLSIMALVVVVDAIILGTSVHTRLNGVFIRNLCFIVLKCGIVAWILFHCLKSLMISSIFPLHALKWKPSDSLCSLMVCFQICNSTEHYISLVRNTV